MPLATWLMFFSPLFTSFLPYTRTVYVDLAGIYVCSALYHNGVGVAYVDLAGIYVLSSLHYDYDLFTAC